VAVGWIVDPKPFIRARREQLAAHHEPRIAALVDQCKGAIDAEDRRLLKDELKNARRAYAKAKRELRALKGPGVNW
jgi:hypothetical protein